MAPYNENENPERAGEQAAALEQPIVQAETGVETPQPKTGDTPAPAQPPATQSGDWKQDVAKLGVDPGWVVGLRRKLVESGKLSMEDISPEKLADPEWRTQLNKMMKQQTAETKAESAAVKPEEKPPSQGGSGSPGTGTGTSSGRGTPYVPASTSAPSVLKPGHLPKVPQWHEAWYPAPSNASAATRTAVAQINGLSKSGDVYPENRS